jgi:glycosyltransferase involved in cell wall biosynthesis
MTDRGVRVAVNLVWCRPGRVGGSEEYLVRQLAGLSELDHGFEVTAFAAQGFAAAHPEIGGRLGVVSAPFPSDRRAVRIGMEHTWLAQRTKGFDLVHHGGGTVPANGSRPAVLTVHDLQYRSLPGYFSVARRSYLSLVMPRSVRRAEVVAVPSNYVRGSVVASFAVPPERVVVVPHGVEPSIGVDATPEHELRRRFGLGSSRIVVYPAITHPHKNHRFLLDLLAGPWSDDDLRLVLLGGRGAAEPDVWSAMARQRLTDRVIRPGRVSRADRDGFIAMAEALVFPSEYEGFGAPVIEAMHLGTPVIASDRASLPEVVGDAGLVLPLDIDTWSGALDEARQRRVELVRAGRDRAQRYTTVRSAEALLGAYRLALG